MNWRVFILLITVLFLGITSPIEHAWAVGQTDSFSAASATQFHPAIENSFSLRSAQPSAAQGIERDPLVYEFVESISLVVQGFYSEWSLQKDLGLRSVQEFQLPRSRAPPFIS